MIRKIVVLTMLLSVIGADVHAQHETGDNTHTNMFSDNPNLVTMDDCAAVDSVITGKCYDLLGEWMHMNDGVNGQLAVLDAHTGHLLTWVALEDIDGNHTNAPLRRNFCSSEVYMPFVAAECLALSHTPLEDYVDTGIGILNVNDSLIIRDHNWRRGGYGRLTYRQALLCKSRIGMYRAMMTMPNGMDYWNLSTDRTKNTNAVEMAATFNRIYHSDSININAARRRNIRDIAICIFKEGGIQYKRAPKEVELAGIYNLADDGKEQTFTFIGCFPAGKPEYAICMAVLRKHQFPASSVMLLMHWLNG